MKRLARPLPTIISTAFTLEAGQKPERDCSLRGALGLREWQRTGLDFLREAVFRILLAPTGSGKSTLIKALSALDLAANPRRLAVIAVPQSIIASSFGEARIMIDGNPINWKADHIIDTAGSIAKLEALLTARESHLRSRTVVCTHQTLVLVHQRLMTGHKGKKSPWQDVALYVDEAHHSRAASEDDDGDDAASNQLGAVVAHYLTVKPGPLLLTTATWMRAQLDDIIPAGHEDTFTRFTYTLEADLRSKQHLKSVAFRFLIGKVDDALRALYSEGNKKTIAYLPHVGSTQVQAAGGKSELLQAYQAAIGVQQSADGWTARLWHQPPKGRGFKVRSLDFVTVEGRDERKAHLASGIARGGGDRTPDILWALNLGKEGFDWPELERAIVIGARGSIPEVLQMMGRVMRDHPGKTNAEFNVILPHDGGPMDPSQVRDYMKMILASMVVEWPFKLPNLTPAAAREDRPKKPGAAASIVERMEDPTEAVRVIEAVVDRALQGGGAEKDDAVIAGALKGLFPGATDDERGEAADRVKQMFTSRSKAMMANAADLPFDVEVIDGALGCVRALAMQIGHTTLAELRSAIGRWSSVTATIDDVLEFGRGMSVAEYRAKREPGMPDPVEFPKHYDGMVFSEVMTGVKFTMAPKAVISVDALKAALIRFDGNARKTAVQFGVGKSAITKRIQSCGLTQYVAEIKSAMTQIELRDLIRLFGGSQREFAKAAGVSTSKLGNHLASGDGKCRIGQAEAAMYRAVKATK